MERDDSDSRETMDGAARLSDGYSSSLFGSILNTAKLTHYPNLEYSVDKMQMGRIAGPFLPFYVLQDDSRLTHHHLVHRGADVGRVAHHVNTEFFHAIHFCAGRI